MGLHFFLFSNLVLLFCLLLNDDTQWRKDLSLILFHHDFKHFYCTFPLLEDNLKGQLTPSTFIHLHVVLNHMAFFLKEHTRYFEDFFRVLWHSLSWLSNMNMSWISQCRKKSYFIIVSSWHQIVLINPSW